MKIYQNPLHNGTFEKGPGNKTPSYNYYNMIDPLKSNIETPEITVCNITKIHLQHVIEEHWP